MSKSDAHVWHFVLVRSGRPPSTGDRIATLALPAELVEKVGPERIARAVEFERRKWSRYAIARGYVDGYGVQVISERGFRRSMFPAAAIPGIAPVQPVKV